MPLRLFLGAEPRDARCGGARSVHEKNPYDRNNEALQGWLDGGRS